jgi:hypothetical protein
MVRAIKQTVTIKLGGRIEVTSDQLPEGRRAEVIILVEQEPPPKSYSGLFGSGRGAFATPEEADAFLRRERDAWSN